MHPEPTELHVQRPGGQTVRILRMPDLVDDKRLQGELLQPLARPPARKRGR